MSASANEEATQPATAPSALSASPAARLVAVVISALVYGALVYISRFTPHVFGIQLLYPAPAVAPAFGLWFGVWGALGVVLGTVISQLPAGLNPLIWFPANLGQALYALVPALLYRQLSVDSVQSWLRYAVACLLAAVGLELLLAWNLALNGYVAFDVGMRTVFPTGVLTDVLWMVVVGPVVLNTVSPYVVRAGLRIRGLV